MGSGPHEPWGVWGAEPPIVTGCSHALTAKRVRAATPVQLAYPSRHARAAGYLRQLRQPVGPAGALGSAGGVGPAGAAFLAFPSRRPNFMKKPSASPGVTL